MSSKRHTAREQGGPAGIERPRMAAPAGNMAAFGSDVVAETLRALDIPYIALNPGRELSRPARQPRQLPRQRAPQMLLCLHEESAVAIAHGYAKVTGRAMAAARAFQRRADARHHGDLQRLVRPHAGADARRDRPGRRGEAPAVDRLDPHRARPGRDHPQLHQVGRPAGLAGRRARVGAARLLDRRTPRRWARPTSISTPRCRRRKLAEPLPPIDAERFMPPVAERAGRSGRSRRRPSCSRPRRTS